MLSYLILVNTLSHGPRGDNVVHDPLREGLGYLVQLHELPHTVQNVVVSRRRRSHLLDDRRHVTEDGGVEQG